MDAMLALLLLAILLLAILLVGSWIVTCGILSIILFVIKHMRAN